MQNVFIDYIVKGKIRDLAELRSAYTKIVMKTHPDTVGSDRLVNRFIVLTDLYESAKQYLLRKESGRDESKERLDENVRLSFFKNLHALEALDFPYNTKKGTYVHERATLKDEAFSCFSQWRKGDTDLYVAAQREYELIRSERPYGPYRKHALYLNLRPVFHNVIAFHLTGLQFYRMQVKQNLGAVIKRLEEREFVSLRDYLLLLIADMDNGPALMNG
jgi:hypothetical protein